MNIKWLERLGIFALILFTIWCAKEGIFIYY